MITVIVAWCFLIFWAGQNDRRYTFLDALVRLYMLWAHCSILKEEWVLYGYNIGCLVGGTALIIDILLPGCIWEAYASEWGRRPYVFSQWLRLSVIFVCYISVFVYIPVQYLVIIALTDTKWGRTQSRQLVFFLVSCCNMLDAKTAVPEEMEPLEKKG